MRIEKAIEILTDFDNGEYYYDVVTLRKSVKLGIEALKKIRECQRHNCTLSNIELPGETEE